ncbi:16S rRNA (cytosine(1402)-N(4))-methyltransferase RsmH [Candidatus Peregrinibacteria bacterium]|nr:16S rRNA (cytosine(1402)-N(4))-methyltransferase RsmH [Candidatus Peregrinibacteria bacterium]
MNSRSKKRHIPVLKEDVEKFLDLKEGGVVADLTLGLGGHAEIILKKIGKNGYLYAFEQDARNLKEAKIGLSAYKNQITYVHDNFRYLKSRVTEASGKRPSAALPKNIDPHVRSSTLRSTFSGCLASGHFPEASTGNVDAILLDLGLSSPHVDIAESGFSFMADGPLDMRFDQRNVLTAGDVINVYPESRLVKIFFEYGEERLAKKIARDICTRRLEKKFSSTKELADYIEEIVPKKYSKAMKGHPATKIFQALRIEVNDELSALKEVLPQAMEILKPNGRIVIISYHSLEDRIVKQFFKGLERPKAEGQDAIYSNFGEPIVKALTKKPVIPTQKEIEENNRSRSAKLRAYQKLK